MSLPSPVSSPADTTGLHWFSGSTQAPRAMPEATPASTEVTDAQPPQLTPTESKRAPPTVGPWLRRKGWVRHREGRWARCSELRLPGGRERSKRRWVRARGRPLRLCNGKGVLEPGQPAWAGGLQGKRKKEAPILPLVAAGDSGPGDKTLGPPKRETPHCTQLGSAQSSPAQALPSPRS